MATTIHSLAYKMSADSAGFTRGVAASRKELTAAKRVMRETETPLEKYNRKVGEADMLLKKGLITQKQYNRQVAGLKGSLKGATTALTAFGAGVVTAFGAGAVKLFSTAVAKISENMEKLDKVGKLSDKLSVPPQAIRGLQFAAGQLSGLGGEQLAAGLTTMQNRVSEAAAGTGEAVKALNELGLSAEGLNRLSADRQFLRLADAIRDVKNPADQLRLAIDLFDKRVGSKLVSTLRAGSSGVGELSGRFDKFAGKLSTLDIDRIEELNDALGLTNVAVEGLFEQLTAEFSVPALAAVKELNQTIEKTTGSRVSTRGEVGLSAASFAQSATGALSRVGAGSTPGVFGAGFSGVVNALLQQVPDIVKLAEKHHSEAVGQQSDLHARLLAEMQRNTEATRQSGIAIELPPGSR